MGTGNFTDDFKRDAVAQITERATWSRRANVSARRSITRATARLQKRTKCGNLPDGDQASPVKNMDRAAITSPCGELNPYRPKEAG